MSSMTAYLRSLLRRSGATYLDLLKVLLPVLIVVEILDALDLSQWLAVPLDPVMRIVGLPGETAIVWAIGLLTGLYGGVGAYIALLPDLQMSVGQHSAFLTMLLFAHALPVEQAIVRRAGGSFAFTCILRIGTALAFGIIVTSLCEATGWLSEPAELLWAPGATQADEGLAGWLWSTANSLAILFVIITALIALLDGLKRLGSVEWMTQKLAPVLQWIGISRALAPLTMIGFLLGLTYGGALIIQAAKAEGVDGPSTRRSLYLLSMCHALIEDTLLVLALGADIMIVLVGRVLFTFAVMAGFAALTRSPAERGQPLPDNPPSER